MLEINQIKIEIQKEYENLLHQKVLKMLRVRPSDVKEFRVVKRSIDARKKPELFYVFTVRVTLSKELEAKILKNPKIKNVKQAVIVPYIVPKKPYSKKARSVIVGAGPAGLFAAYVLCLSGNPPLLIERGKSVEERSKDVEEFFETGVLKPDSNVQFGEGGAGTFSDGKLNTQVNDKNGRNTFVLDTFVRFGANPEILIDPKPHVGTDTLKIVVKNLRNELTRLGAEVRFETALTDLRFEKNHLTEIEINHKEVLPCENLILAIGHSARDTFRMLYEKPLSMQAKSFAVGFRVEHPQEFIDHCQYGKNHALLPASPYKLTANLENGRSVYSFCMCPGGYVVNASSEEEMLAVNGMSYMARDSKNANSAIVVSVGAGEYSLDDPMAAIEYQRNIEHKAFELGEGQIPQQLLQDFVDGKKSTTYGSFSSVTKGHTKLTDLTPIFSQEIRESFIAGMRSFDHKMHGFYMEDAILSGVESRTSSPVRIPRDDTFQSAISGIYPCGEGAGYAGGITSAAMDGMKVAEHLLLNMEQV